MATHFTNVSSNDGFDDSLTPPWQMVPESGAKIVNLIDGSGMDVASSDNSTVTILEVPLGVSPLMNARQFVLMGLRTGTATITASPSGGFAAASLDVTVKPLVRITTQFHLVEDSASPAHKTVRTSAQVDSMVNHANRILLPQANICIRKAGISNTTVAGDLGTVVRFVGTRLQRAGVPAAEHEWDDVVAHRDSSAAFNVFFVWAYEQDNTPHQDNANAGTLAAEGNCLLEDDAIVPGRTLAHETCHYRGIRGHSSSTGPENLMGPAPRVSGRGEEMTRAQIDVVNS